VIQKQNIRNNAKIIEGFSIKTKIIAVFIFSVMMLSLLVAFFAVDTCRDKILEAAQEKLKSDLALGRTLLEAKYPGDWSIREGMLYKGQNMINNNFEVVDEISALTGDTVTIFQGKKRVSTNVKIDGQRAVGTDVSDEVAEVVLEEGEVFIGKANVVGMWNQTAYEPIETANGEIIGIWYVGVPNETYDKIIDKFAKSIIWISLLGTIIVGIIGFLTANRLLNPIISATKLIQRISEGNLAENTLEVTSKDEVGVLRQSLNIMQNNLRQMLTNVRNCSEDLFEATQEMSGSAQQVSSGAEEQSSSIQKVSKTINEMAIAEKQIADNALEASNSANKAKDISKQGKNNIENIANMMNDININMSKLNQNSEKIGEILIVIDDIANQTNLLALNASIEAARAGEHGKGFVVVAEEVRKLAERSGKAAKEISQLIKTSQEDTYNAVGVVQKGSKITEESVQDFHSISQLVEHNSEMVDQIADACQQQAAGTEELRKATENIASIVEEGSASMEELSATFQQLLAMAQDLQNVSNEFQIG